MTATIDPPVTYDDLPDDPFPQDGTRTPPNDVGAERAVLGAMILSKDAATEIREILASDDFYSTNHATIFRTICDLHDAGQPADQIILAAKLQQAGELRKIGHLYPHTLVESVPTAANGTYYARIVAERAVLRRLVEAGTRITQLAYAQDARPLDKVVTMAQEAVNSIAIRQPGDGFILIGDLLQETLDEVEAAGDPKQQTGVPTGFEDVDRLLNGLQKGQLIILAGRPAMGKSVAAVDVLRHAAIRCGMPAALVALEMSKVEVVTRILSAEARVPLHALRSGHVEDTDWTKLARAMNDIGDAPLHIDDTATVTLADIRARALKLKQQHGLRLLVIDYLQLMSTAGRTESRQQEVGDLSRGLKLLAKELEVPIIAVSQLNRGPENRPNKRPTKADLRESGSLENDADVVWLVHRDDYYDKESPRAGEADFIFDKSRSGPPDTITVAAQLHLSRFVDMAM
jgi:replicative DNA helicase